jgi:hypothetical protein
MRRTVAIHIGLMLVASIAAGPGFAQSQSDRRPAFRNLRLIQCAAASDLCVWKRIPRPADGLRGGRRAEREIEIREIAPSTGNPERRRRR